MKTTFRKQVYTYNRQTYNWEPTLRIVEYVRLTDAGTLYIIKATGMAAITYENKLIALGNSLQTVLDNIELITEDTLKNFVNR